MTERHPLGTNPIAMEKRFVTLAKRKGDWHILLIERDQETLLRIIPFGSVYIARWHGRKLAAAYNAVDRCYR